MQTLTARRKGALARRVRDVESYALVLKSLRAMTPAEDNAEAWTAEVAFNERKRACAVAEVLSLKRKLGLPV